MSDTRSGRFTIHELELSPAASPSRGGGSEQGMTSLFEGRAAGWPALLVVAGADARAAGWGPEAAVELAALAARVRRPVFLADLDQESPVLHARLGVPSEEGIADVALFGVSVRRAAQRVKGHPFLLVPAGLTPPDPEEVLTTPHWAVILSEVTRMRGLLLLYVPSDAPGLGALASRVGHALLLAGPDEAVALPGDCEVVGVLGPRGTAAEAPAEPDPVTEPDAVAEPEPAHLPGLEPPAVVEPEPVPAAAFVEAPEPAREVLVEPAAVPVFSPAAPPARPLRYSVPVLPAWKERVIRAFAVLTLVYGVYYVGWRWTATLNPEALWFSLPLVLAETWGLITAFIMVHSVWRLSHRRVAPAPPGLSVDVFITVYDEPLEVVRRTAVGARAIRYPHRTYILDDGKREEVRAMAEELGVDYLRREGNEHAKAGNLNHALRHTDGEFVLQLDADHVPLPNILDALLGFFAQDPKLAFVQSPQDFYNTDAFTYDVNEAWHRIWEEQRLFFSVIQPGKDSVEAAFFCGSCAVFRREALDDIGGFSTHSVTEDIETSLLLHSRGWRSAYYGESLAYGLAAGSAAAFHVQHLRWGQGAMQVLRKFNPLTFPGLTFSQRISYFGSLTAYVGGVQKLIFYSAPLVYFLTGVLPIRAIDREFLVRFIPFLVLSFASSEMLARGTANTWISERYHMAKFWTYTRAVASFFFRRPLRFRVTPKAPGHVPFATYAPHVGLMVLTVVAVVWATLAHQRGWIDYGVDGWESTAFQANFLWSALNFFLAASVVRLSLRVRHQRTDHRFRDQFAIHLRVQGSDVERGRSYLALTENLNPGGIAFRISRYLEPGTRVKLVLPLATGTVRVEGEVVHTQQMEEGAAAMFHSGVRFEGVPVAVRDAIELHCTHHAVPLHHSRYRSTLRLLSRTSEWVRDARRERRRRVHLPARVVVGGRSAQAGPGRRTALLEEISRGGARLVMDEPVAPGAPIVYRVPGTDIRGRGRVVFSRAEETPIGVRFAIGVRRIQRVRREPQRGRNMQIPEVLKRASTLLAIVAGLALGQPAAAQLQPVVYGAAESDTEGLTLLLLGGAVSTTNPGLGVVAGVTGYSLSFPTGLGNETARVAAVQPYVGPRFLWSTGAVQATVGYQFLDTADEGEEAFGTPLGGREGVVTALQGNYWGTGARSAQAIVSYNWGSEYAWGQLRALQLVGTPGGIPLSLGAELVAQGGGTGDTALEPDYQAIQFGPAVEVAFSPGFRLAGVVGMKSDNRPQEKDFFPFFKLDFVLIP